MDIYESFKSENFIAPTLTLIYSEYVDAPLIVATKKEDDQ